MIGMGVLVIDRRDIINRKADDSLSQGDNFLFLLLCLLWIETSLQMQPMKR